MALTTTPTNAISLSLSGSIGLSGAEITAYDAGSKRAYVTSNTGLRIVDLTNPAAPTLIGTIDFTTLGLTSNDVSSVAIKNGIVACSIIATDKTQPGSVVLLNAATGALIKTVAVGANPDMVTFTPDGSKILVANEGELAVGGGDAEGSVSIINIAGGAANATVQTAGFGSFNGQEAALRAAGVRIFDGKTVSQDVEPEYIAVSPDGTKAMITLQENNAVAILDLATGTITSIVALGTKDFSTLLADFSDRDGPANSAVLKLGTGQPVKALYMPDSIASFQAGGQTYYVMANEGDDRDDFLASPETIRLGAAGYDLDNTLFPNEATLKGNAVLGRLNVSNATGLRGDTDGDGDIDQILAYGGRSFSIVDANGNRVFDSGDFLDRLIAEHVPSLYDDTRSDNKSLEPEGLTVSTINGRTYVFVGLERATVSSILVFDITDPANVNYVGMARNTGDVSPEGLTVVTAAESPAGKALLLVSNEVSNTLTVFTISDGGVPAQNATGPSTTQTPYLVGIEPNIFFTSLLSAGDAVGLKKDGVTPWRMVGVPDGLGAYDNGNGTVTVLMNHEIGNTAGVVREHGGIGSFISKLTINKSTLAVTAAEDLIDQAYVWNTGTSSYQLSPTEAFVRFCSGDLPVASAFFNSATGKGTTDRIYMAGEENGPPFAPDNGRAFAHVLTGADANKSFELPWLGKISFENVVAAPGSGDKTVLVTLDDTGPLGQVYMYVGDKQSTGTTLEKAGLVGGALYGIKVNGVVDETAATSFGGGATTFSLVATGNVVGQTGPQLQTTSEGLGITEFLRPEDGAWDPTNPNHFYFVTTASITGPSRLYRLEFTDVKNPTAGGTVRMLLDGTEGQIMMDNLTVGLDGKLIIQEDPGNNARLAKVWHYDPVTDTLSEMAEHDPGRFSAPTAPFTRDEESSGVIDVTDLFGAPGQQVYMLDTQAHYAITGEIVEGGQLQLMTVTTPVDGGSGDDTINGSFKSESLSGNAGSDTMKGGSGNDTLNGGIGNDNIDGGKGRDVLIGGDGTNTLNGGLGFDRATYSIASGAATIVRNSDGTVTISGAGFSDTVSNTEIAAFTDRTIALRQMPRSDVNGSGGSDLVLQNGGTVADWIISNGTQQSTNTLTTGATGYGVVGTGDFNGDGTSDIVLQNGGTVVDWIMNAGTYRTGNVITSGAAGFNVVGTGDFNGDGTSDIILQNASTGTIVDWIMQNGAYQSGNTLAAGLAGWNVVGTGDFNGDGTSDVALQNGGTIVSWILQNGAYQSGSVLASGLVGWTVVGTGDLDRDGDSDIVLQNGGTIVDWIMQNGAYQSGNVITTGAAGFAVKAVGDYNGDGTADIVLQNGSTVVQWQMQNGLYASGNVVGNAGSLTVVA